MEQYILFDELEKKEARAMALFRLFEDTAIRYHPDGYYLAFSGGKDSVVIYALAKMAGVRFKAHYHMTTVDPPELVWFIRSSFPEVSTDYPEYSMWNLIVKKQIPPVRTARYCCEVLNERGGEGCFTVTGVRWQERDVYKRQGKLPCAEIKPSAERTRPLGCISAPFVPKGFIRRSRSRLVFSKTPALARSSRQAGEVRRLPRRSCPLLPAQCFQRPRPGQ